MCKTSCSRLLESIENLTVGEERKRRTELGLAALMILISNWDEKKKRPISRIRRKVTQILKEFDRVASHRYKPHHRDDKHRWSDQRSECTRHPSCGGRCKKAPWLTLADPI